MKNLATLLTTTILAVSFTPTVGITSSSFCLNAEGIIAVGANADQCEDLDGLLIVNKRGVQKKGLTPDTTGHYATWTSKYGSLTFSFAGREFARYGMNEAGLVVTTVQLPGSRGPSPDDRPPLEGDFWAQYVLDNFATVEEVAASDSTVRIINDRDHYLICDRTGNCIVIEYLNGETHYYTGESLPVKALSNAPYERCTEHWRKGIIPDPDPDASIERFISASEWLGDFKGGALSGVDYAFDILDHISQGKCTQWRIVFDPGSLVVTFRTKKVKATRYCDLNDFDFSCSTPIVTLDVNEKLSGDVSAQFVECPHESSLDYMETAFERLGVPKTKAEIEELLEFFESFKCSEPGR